VDVTRVGSFSYRKRKRIDIHCSAKKRTQSPSGPKTREKNKKERRRKK